MYVQSVQRVDSYSPELLDAAVAAHFEALGLENELFDGIKVLLKPNLLTDAKPHLAVTTHPAVVLAAARWFASRGVKSITIADSPGGANAVFSDFGKLYTATGMKTLENDAILNFDGSHRAVKTPDGCKSKSFDILTPIADADLIVNLAKLKTHSLTTLSMGIKNLFGCIPGLSKPMFHAKYPAVSDFSNMLVELALTMRPTVTLIDAVDAMEGNGPSGGERRHYGFTFAARDLFSQDYFLAPLVGVEPSEVAMLRIADEKGLVDKTPDLRGDAPQPAEPSFRLPSTVRTKKKGSFVRSVKKPFGKLYVSFPHIDESKCIACLRCAKTCPAKTIKTDGAKPRVEERDCISCFCCHEICPINAIDIVSKLKFKRKTVK